MQLVKVTILDSLMFLRQFLRTYNLLAMLNRSLLDTLQFYRLLRLHEGGPDGIGEIGNNLVTIPSLLNDSSRKSGYLFKAPIKGTESL